MNTHGNLFRITTFGESHGNALGVVIDGLPANFKIDLENIAYELGRRKPGQSKITTQRKENDEDFEILSGIFEGYSTGHPITIIVKNENQKSKDYNNIKDLFRPNHADLTYFLKYGIRDYRGGGRSSGRETLSRVIAGAIAKQYLKEKFGIEIFAFTKQVGKYKCENINYSFIEENILRTADEKKAPEMIKYVEEIASNGNSVGGIIECHIKNPPAGLGEPVFGKIKSILASSMLSIGGVLGFEYGAGFDTVNLTGESYNEGFENKNGKIYSPHNNYSGILGGITTGEDVIFRVAIKPTSSIYSKQKTVDVHGNEVDFQISGRHDPCILPRVIPVIEAMSAIDLLDLVLLDNSRR
ncbi:MAG: chorismate synthase [Candidatus Gracilibacteria bacterium]|nr:chorismate synthase [Candidatus Gracilibacteria bacterium]